LGMQSGDDGLEKVEFKGKRKSGGGKAEMNEVCNYMVNRKYIKISIGYMSIEAAFCIDDIEFLDNYFLDVPTAN